MKRCIVDIVLVGVADRTQRSMPCVHHVGVWHVTVPDDSGIKPKRGHYQITHAPTGLKVTQDNGILRSHAIRVADALGSWCPTYNPEQPSPTIADLAEFCRWAGAW